MKKRRFTCLIQKYRLTAFKFMIKKLQNKVEFKVELGYKVEFSDK